MNLLSQGEIFMIILYANFLSRTLSRSVDSCESNRRNVSSVTRYSLERMLQDPSLRINSHCIVKQRSIKDGTFVVES